MSQVKDRLFGEWYGSANPVVRSCLRDCEEFQQIVRNDLLLLAAASKDLSIQRMEALINDGADVNYVDINDTSVLFHVVINPKVTFEIIKLFVESGADVNTLDCLCNSVLHHVVRYQKPTSDIVRLLLEYGADPDLRNILNQNPLTFCKRKSSAKLLIQYTIMRKMYLNTYCENLDSKIKVSSSQGNDGNTLQLSICESIRGCTFFTDFRDSCFAEMKMMREDMIAEDYTFFNFIADNFLKRIHLPKDKTVDMSAIVEIVLRLCNNKYPNCRDIINVAIRLSNIVLTTRSFNLKMYTVKPLTANSTEQLIFLNAECTTAIENYLTREEVLNLIVAFGHGSVLKSKLCSSKRMREEDEISFLKKLKAIKN